MIKDLFTQSTDSSANPFQTPSQIPKSNAYEQSVIHLVKLTHKINYLSQHLVNLISIYRYTYLQIKTMTRLLLCLTWCIYVAYNWKHTNFFYRRGEKVFNWCLFFFISCNKWYSVNYQWFNIWYNVNRSIVHDMIMREDGKQRYLFSWDMYAYTLTYIQLK